MSEKDPMMELQALSSKRSSLRDKLKKRREAIGSILSQATSSSTSSTTIPTTPTVAPSSTSEEKPKNTINNDSIQEKPSHEGSKKRSVSTSDSKQPIQGTKKSKVEGDDLRSLLSAPSAKEKADQNDKIFPSKC